MRGGEKWLTHRAWGLRCFPPHHGAQFNLGGSTPEDPQTVPCSELPDGDAIPIAGHLKADTDPAEKKAE